ncbi:MAG: hypothetical protein NDI58_00445 [Geothrix sp.]|nr:hypothetical protein [Geothrix sp.]
MADSTRTIKDIEPYSVFGYLLPGAALFGGLIAHWEHPANLAVNGLFKSSNIASIIILTSVFLLISYGIGHALSAVSGLIFDTIIADILIGYPIDGLFKPAKKVKLFDWLKYYVSFTDSTKIRLEFMFLEKFKYKPSRSEFYWIAFSAVAAQSNVGVNRILSFVGLYGFSRNLSAAFLMLIPFPPYYLTIYGNSFWMWVGICLFFSFARWLNYMKLLKLCDTEICTHFLVL